MGFGSLVRKIGGAASKLARSPIGKAAGLIPGVGTVVSGIGLASAGYSAVQAVRGAVGGGGGAGLPALPMAAGAAPMPMPGAGFPGAAGMGQRSIFRDDPNVIEQLKPWAIPMRGLRTYYRAPKGFVVMRDQVGDPYGIPKKMAQAYLGWKPAKKPLLSVRDTSALRRAGVAIKKLQNAEKMAKKIANWKSPRRSAAPLQVLEAPGRKVIGRKTA